MHLLKPSEYRAVNDLAAGLGDQGMALSVLAGIRPGVVAADDAERPTSLFIGAPEGGFAWTYLAGDPSNASFHRELNEWLFDARGLGPEVGFSFLACDGLVWEEALPEILSPRTVIPDRRLHYECTTRPHGWQEVVPEGYTIRTLDRQLLASDVELHEQVAQWMTGNFGSVDGFLRHGFGAAAVHEEKVVSWCLADSFIDGLSDIGGETEEAHRRKGLFFHATRRTLELAFERGAERIGWHCHAINVPSARAAEKAGFELRYEYPVYPVQFDAERHEKLASIIAGEYIEAADEALQKSEYADADALFRRLQSFSGIPSADVLHSAALAAAAVGDVDRAFTLLETAMERGWRSATHTMSRPEFESLCGDARWPTLLERMESPKSPAD